MKYVVIALGCFVVLGFASALDGDDQATSYDEAVASAPIDEPSGSHEVASLAAEGEELAGEVASLAGEASEAARNANVGQVCELMEEMDPKINRLSEIVDELDSMGLEPSRIEELRGYEAQMRTGFAPAQELCG